MNIAVDFDGTIVEHRYPAIGKEIPFAVATLKALAKEGHKLVLWSVREGELLDEAVAWCHERGLDFYAANRDYPDEVDEPTVICRKLKVDMFIDDRNFGGLPDWGVIYEVIHNNMSLADYYRQAAYSQPEEKKGFWARLKGDR